MSRILRLLAIIVALSLIAIVWFWWNRPKRVDMTANVPADSLVYLEANGLPDIAATITETDGWKQLAPYLAIKSVRRQNDWLSYFLKMTGIGPTVSVIATRAQMAFVLLDLSSISNGDTLEFKPVAALVVETHTSESRVKPAVKDLLSDFARRAYANPKFELVNLSEGEFFRWIAPDGQRRIVATFDGSVVVIGNDEKAVSACLAARRGQRPSALHQPELEAMRARLHASEALAFGYVSSANIARLVSEGAPLLLGKLSRGIELQNLLAGGAGKILGNVGWSARSFKGGIEDSYSVSLKPGVVMRLRPAFLSTDQGLQGAWEFLPAEVYSVTTYNLRDPSATWDSLNAAVSSQLDALSAVVFTAGFRALLAPYGIDEPDMFLKAIQPEVLTVRVDAQSDRALVVARIANANSLHQFVLRRFGANPRAERMGDNELVLAADDQYAASFAGNYFLLGSPEDVRRCLAARATQNAVTSSPTRLAALTHYLERPGNSSVVTYAKDNDRVRALIATLTTISGSRSSPSWEELDRIINELPYATTETSLGEDGFERRTRSPFGQFSSLVSLLAPEPVRPPAK